MIFIIQKRNVRIIASVKSRNSCRKVFMRSENLPIPCIYILIIMNISVNNQESF
jgi:hypothetical protein